MPNDHDPLPGPQQLAELPPDGGTEFNRLVFQTSPYLLQHARNPVDWYPWGEEAFERARDENKPVLVSIGYSTCHWCHVMERESFEDPEVAEVLNKHVVPVKVDREQRPDLDTLYMTAAQVMTGSGGWPLNVMLTPEGEPFFAATYIPPRPAYGRPGVTTLVPQLAALYRAEDPRIRQTIEQLKPIMQQHLSGLAELAPEGPSTEHVQAALESFVQSVDPVRGGTEGAPKFPPHGALKLVLETHRDLDAPEAFEATRVTLDGMARGGIHDHVGGGFHRYSTDADWLVPHFEKMLYDNAQLLYAYAEAFAQTGSALYDRAARGIVQWLGREMTAPDGGFYSALDADSEGEEGRFYTWTWDELTEVLDEADLTFAARVYGLSPQGNYRDEATGQPTGRNIPALQGPLETLAENSGTSTTDLLARLDEINGTLLGARNSRVRPGLDDKILAAWNGLTIGALAHAGTVMNEPEWVDRAERAAGFIIDNLVEDDLLQRSIRAGKPSGPGYLDDYACTAHGLLALHRATGNGRYLEVARRLAEVVLERFAGEGGLFAMTDNRHDRLMLRPHDVLDQATPSGNGVLASALVHLASLDDDPRWREAAHKLLRTTCPLVRRIPAASHSIASAAWAWVRSEAVETGGEDILAEVEDGVLRLAVTGAPPEVSPGETLELTLALEIAEGLHVNAYRPGVEGLVGVHLQADEPWELAEVDYPEGDLLGGPGRAHPRVYTGRVVLPITLRAPKHVGPGSATVNLSLSAQPCTEASCLDVRTVQLAVPATVRG